MTVEAMMRMLAASGSYQNDQNRAIVERPDPRILSAFSLCPETVHTWVSNLCPPDQELGALTKWLASGDASLSLGRLLYITPSSTALVGTELGYRGVLSAMASAM
jgi:hypothetical protein